MLSTLLEIILRTTIIYVVVLLGIRITGKQLQEILVYFSHKKQCYEYSKRTIAQCY